MRHSRSTRSSFQGNFSVSDRVNHLTTLTALTWLIHLVAFLCPCFLHDASLHIQIFQSSLVSITNHSNSESSCHKHFTTFPRILACLNADCIAHTHLEIYLLFFRISTLSEFIKYYLCKTVLGVIS